MNFGWRWPFCWVVGNNILLLVGAVQLISTNDNFLSVVSGFTARLQCSLYRCRGEQQPNIAWYKNELLIFNGTDFQPTSGIDPANVLLQRTTVPDPGDTCATDEYTLLLKNLTLQDAGKYRCQLHREPQQLDFHIDVLESGLRKGFHENISYDYSECCVERGISPLCRGMCKPKDLYSDFFDPTACKTKDYKNFLHCATDAGKFDYVPCCRQKSVPSFCYDFCSFGFEMLKRSHRLCIYFLPEIFDCFNRGSLRIPENPVNLQVREGRRHRRVFCWQSANNGEAENVQYSVHIREVPILMPPPRISHSGRRHRPRRAFEHSGDHLSHSSAKSNILLVLESDDQREPEMVRLDREQIESGRKGETCVSLDNLRVGARYVLYVQSTNESGTSEPSAPLFAII